MRGRVEPRAAVVLAGDRWIERRENAVGIVSIDPDVAIEMRFEHVRLVGLRRGVVIIVSSGTP
jgi:hypothetical protein